MKKSIEAHEIAGNPDYFNLSYRFKGYEWECMGYSRTGETIKFSRLEIFNQKLKQVNCYLKPHTKLSIS